MVQEGSAREEFASLADLCRSGKHEIVRAVLKRMNGRGYGLELNIFSGTRPRSGLGGSAALFVALLSLFSHIEREYRLDSYSLSELAWSLERDELGNLGGRQDQYASVFGGLNYLEFLKSGFVRVTRLALEPATLRHLENSLVLFWLGDRPRSGGVIEDQIKKIETGANIESLHLAKTLTEEMKLALLRGDVPAVGKLLEEGWQAKKGFSSMVSTPEIDAFHDRLMAAGMVGGKVTGAGGGGHFLAYVELENRQRVIETALAMGAEHVPFAFEPSGAVTWQMPRRDHGSGGD
ncbi:MAG: hypothetical protein QME94_04205 [Anaerolineae bacterium]|nr:hypothetical protein [Anaerolineae bacterium]